MQQIKSIEDHANKSSGKSSYGNEGHTMREMIEGVSKKRRTAGAKNLVERYQRGAFAEVKIVCLRPNGHPRRKKNK